MISFKDPMRQTPEYFLLPRILREALMMLEKMLEPSGMPMTITSIFRTEDEQREICSRKGVPFYQSVHMFYRGADVRRLGIPTLDANIYVKKINDAIQYDDLRPTLKTVILEHDHFHFQCKA